VGARCSAIVETGPGGPPSLLYNGYRFFPEGKERPGRDADPSPSSSAVGHERVELYLYSPYGPYGLYRASVPVQGCTYHVCYTNCYNKIDHYSCSVLGYYTASSGNSLPTFRDNISFPSSRINNPKRINYLHTLHNKPEERRYHLRRSGSLKSREMDNVL